MKRFIAVLMFFSLSYCFGMDDSFAWIHGDFYRAENLMKQKKQNEAFALYGKVCSADVPDDYGWNDGYQQWRNYQQQACEKIRSLAPTKLQEVENLAKQHKYEDAYKIIALLKLGRIGKAVLLEQKIKQAELEWNKTKNVKEKPLVEEWIFLRKIPKQECPDNTNPTGWRIFKGFLEIKGDTEDPVSANTIAEVIQYAQEDKIPGILVGLRKDCFYHFYEGSGPFLEELTEKWKNPETRGIPDVVEIYFIGDNGEPQFFKKMNQQDIKDAFLKKLADNYWQEEYKLREDLAKPGYGQFFVANLYYKQSLPADPILMQIARQWYVWAMKYLPKESKEYKEAQKQLKQIPDNPRLLNRPKSRPVNQPQPVNYPDAFTKSLLNLTQKLQQFSVKLR